MLLCLLAGTAARGTDVFIDPTRMSSCPGAGTPDSPYCGWDEVTAFSGGNRYLQRRGTTWRGALKVAAGPVFSAGKPLFIGSYGEGEAPTIRVDNSLPGALDPRNWQHAGGGVWKFSTAGYAIANPAVLLLDGRRAFGAALRAEDLCLRKGTQRIEWHHAADALALCSPRGNPAQVFSSISGMQVRSAEPWAPVLIENQRHIIIDGLALEGGRWGAIEIRGNSSDIEIRNCVIGRDSASGIRAQGLESPVRRLDIHDNVIDSGIRWGVVAYAAAVPGGEGVHFSAGVEDSRVRDNVIVAWPHNGLYLDAHAPGSPGVTGNRIIGNEFHCGPSSGYYDYCRPFGVDGFGPGAAHGNLFFDNRMHDFSVAPQVNGNDNYFVGNRCYDTVNSGARNTPTGQCFSLQAYGWSRDNLIANNTLVNTADVAIQFKTGAAGVATGHRVLGNIMAGCGRATTPRRRDSCIAISADPSVGSLTVVGNLLHNPGRPVRILYRQEWPTLFGDVRASGGDTIEGNTLADPRFRDPTRADFGLLPGSPAVDAGRRFDVPGLRLADDTPDIGAVQSGADAGGWTVRP